MSEMKHPGLAETVGHWDEAQQHLAWKVVQTHERSIELLSAEIMRREHPRCERLTDEERRNLEYLANFGVSEPSLGPDMIDEASKALRIIDAHAAERAALVSINREQSERLLKAEHETARLRADRTALVAQLEAKEMLVQNQDALRIKVQAQVAELTRELDEARVYGANAQNTAMQQSLNHEREVARLTEALAAAEAENMRLRNDPMSRRAYAAEAQVQELEAQHDRDIDDMARAVRNEDRAHALATEWQRTAESYRFALQALRTEHEKTLAKLTRG